MLLNKTQMTATFAGLIAFTGVGMSAVHLLSAPPVSAQVPSPTPVVHYEKHPELRAALRNLRIARVDLQKGAHDFQGERVEALKDTDKAIAEIEQALKSDRH